MAKQFKPLFARVVLKKHIPTQQGRIIIPDQFQKQLTDQTGEVIAVGPTCDATIKVGQTVYLGKHAGAWIKMPGTDDELFICQDEDILATIEEVV